MPELNSNSVKDFSYPSGMYYLARFFYNHPRLALKVNDWESWFLRNKMAERSLDRPIYISGLVRAGTTILIEMLSNHPAIANHRYLHMVNPYIPHWIQKVANMTFLFKKPVHRLHKDRILVTRESPEAVEEVFWQFFFDGVHDGGKSNILDSDTRHLAFEDFYRGHLKKLLVNQRASRYATKNNYNISRLEYLLSLFPDAKFLLVIRNPISHVASLMKQDRLFYEMEREDKRLLHWTKLIGHREFGSAKTVINLDDPQTAKEIKSLWANGGTAAKGWALYWAKVYGYLDQLLQQNHQLAEASLIIRYEDLCKNSVETLDKMVAHLEISAEKFRPIKEAYVGSLEQPSYYDPSFSDQELKAIKEATSKVAKKYGYF